MKYIENFIISFQLKRLIGKLIKTNVNPFKPKETVYLYSKGLKLKIVSERKPGWQRINVYLDNHYKIRLSRTDCRHSRKRLNTSLNKKIQHEYLSIIDSLNQKSDSGLFSYFKRNLLSISK